MVRFKQKLPNCLRWFSVSRSADLGSDPDSRAGTIRSDPYPLPEPEPEPEPARGHGFPLIARENSKYPKGTPFIPIFLYLNTSNFHPMANVGLNVFSYL